MYIYICNSSYKVKGGLQEKVNRRHQQPLQKLCISPLCPWMDEILLQATVSVNGDFSSTCCAGTMDCLSAPAGRHRESQEAVLKVLCCALIDTETFLF